ncbi:MAG TPA: hypothetical protein VKE22_04240 [Haliangiales bacterium]|nr:hypothetical protein [Haliangiales bacterium]
MAFDDRERPAPAQGPVEETLLAAARDAFAALAAAGGALGEQAARVVADARAGVDEVLAGRRLTIAVAGETARTRAELLNHLVGEPLVSPARVEPAGARTRFRRGPISYRATLKSGVVEELARLCPDRSQELAGAAAQEGRSLDEARRTLADADAALARAERSAAEGTEAVAAAERALAEARRVVRDASGRCERAGAERRSRAEALELGRRALPAWARARRPWWAFWWWIRLLLFGRRWSAARAQAAAASRDVDDSEEAHRHAARELELAERALTKYQAAVDAGRRAAHSARADQVGAASAAERARAEAGRWTLAVHRRQDELARHVAARREQFRADVRALIDAAERATEVEELMVDAPGVPDGVVLIDLATRGHVLDLQRGWDVCRREADACLLSDGTLPREAQRLFAPATLLAVPPAPPDALVARARLLVVGRRAGEALRAGVDALREARLRAAAEAKARRARIAALEVPDPAAFVSAELDRAAGDIAERANLAIQSARYHVESQLAPLCGAWQYLLRAAADIEELRAAASAIERDASDALATIGAEVERVIGATLAGAVHDLAPTVLAEVRRRRAALEGAELPPAGEPAPDRAALVPPLPPWPALSVAGASRLGALFRSFESVRDECAATLAERAAALRHAVVADLLAAEPAAAARLRQALAPILSAALADLDRRVAEAMPAAVGGEADPVEVDLDRRRTFLERHVAALAERLL